jgi:hypothetical protein
MRKVRKNLAILSLKNPPSLRLIDMVLSVTDPVFRGQICLTDTKMTDRTEKRWKILSLRSIQTDLRTDDR